MLGADLLASAAADAVRCAGAGAGVDILVIIIGVPVVVDVLGVHDGEQVGDGDLLRAAVYTVAAGCAGDQVLLAEDLHHLGNGRALGFVQRLKVPHKAEVILHLLHIAHAGQHHHDTGEARRKPDGIAGRAAAVQRFQHRGGVLGQVDQIAALDRLHDKHRLIVPAADLIAFAALHGDVIVIQIVELDLHDLDLRVLGQDPVQHLGAVVEGETDMADLALGLEVERRLIRAARLELLKILGILGVHEVKVKIIHTAGRKLARKERADVGLGFKKASGQLIGQDIAFARVTAGQAGPERRLASAADVAVRGVKIVEALRQKCIDHLLCLGKIDLLALHGQPHTAEAEIPFDFFHWQTLLSLILIVANPRPGCNTTAVKSRPYCTPGKCVFPHETPRTGGCGAFWRILLCYSTLLRKSTVRGCFGWLMTSSGVPSSTM